MSKKPLIVFEGIETSGKTTHINYISNYLKKKKIKFIKIREPGGSKNSEQIRKMILSNKSNFSKQPLFVLTNNSITNFLTNNQLEKKRKPSVVNNECCGVTSAVE